MSEYAWIIDKDHLSGPGGEFFDPKNPHDHGEGVIGPSDANVDEVPRSREENKTELTRNYENRHQFRMYDDDGILYYTGTLFWNGDVPEEEYVYGPLGDYGMPNAGAVLIKYTGKPEWDCG